MNPNTDRGHSLILFLARDETAKCETDETSAAAPKSNPPGQVSIENNIRRSHKWGQAMKGIFAHLGGTTPARG